MWTLKVKCCRNTFSLAFAICKQPAHVRQHLHCALIGGLATGTRCSGIIPAQLAGGPGFNPRCVHHVMATRSFCEPWRRVERFLSPTVRVAYWVRRLSPKEEIVGSSPTSGKCMSDGEQNRVLRTSPCPNNWVHSSVVRADNRRSAGPWFKSGCALSLYARDVSSSCSANVLLICAQAV